MHLIGDEAADADLRIDFVFTDLHDETWTVWVRRGVLNARRGASADAQLTVSGPEAALIGVALEPAAAGRLVATGQVRLTGDESVLPTFGALLDEFDPIFDIVTPERCRHSRSVVARRRRCDGYEQARRAPRRARWESVHPVRVMPLARGSPTLILVVETVPASSRRP